MPYLRRFYHVPAELEDLVLADLWEAGTLGVQSVAGPDGEVRLEAWFPEGSEPTLAILPARPGVRPGAADTVADLDWLAGYRAQATPFPVGRTLFVDPREPEEPELETPSGRRLLRLPARTAFGIGSHESTSLAIDLLEDCDLRGRRVLDVGTGTGILAFASLLLGAAEVVAFDIDPASPFNAMVNRRLNRLHPRLFIGTSAALRPPRLETPFDLELINVIPEEIGPEMPGLVDRLSPEGEAILSGILEEKGEEVLETVGRLGLVERERRTAGEWIAFRVGRWR
jgi:ribosomal protein L11 methyltransferase